MHHLVRVDACHTHIDGLIKRCFEVHAYLFQYGCSIGSLNEERQH